MQIYFLMHTSMKPILLVFVPFIFLLSACQPEKIFFKDTVKEENSPIIVEPKRRENVDDTINNDSKPINRDNIDPIKAPEPAKTIQKLPDDDEELAPIAKTTFTVAEVAEHASESDCWLILSGKVYEVTEFIPSHPGGKAILK